MQILKLPFFVICFFAVYIHSQQLPNVELQNAQLQQSQLFEWQKLSKQETVSMNKAAGYEFLDSSKVIKYTVTCSKICDVYLVDHDNFQKMISKQQFVYLRKLKNVTFDTVTWDNTNDIHRHLVVAAVNRYSVDPITASFAVEQLAPKGTSAWTTQLVITIVLASLCCCISFVTGGLVVGGTIYGCMFDKLGWLEWFKPTSQDKVSKVEPYRKLY